MATKARKGFNRLIVAIGAVNAVLWIPLFVVAAFEPEPDHMTLVFGGLAVAGFAVPFALLRLAEWVWEGFFGE